MHKILIVLLIVLLQAQAVPAAEKDSQPSEGDRLVKEYFASETAKLSEAAFAEIETLEDWTEQREKYRREMNEMFGLDPMPAKTDLNAVITGELQSEEFTVEKLHFQSMPGLYVTANLYRPKNVTEPLPAILYVCGHGRVKVDGISYGNKATYQHHGSWFARNGYVCMIVDTIQLGEIEGMHHGTYRYGKWWWNNRGYTPAGVEAWNAIRAIDYLQSRDDVDGERIGVTGRSGGGASSWWAAALDERVKVAVPVAGITTLYNHIVDGCVEGHCDCMYMVNTYRWDYAKLAAMVAPRPLLISNTDKDRIFWLEGVVDVHNKVRKIYNLYGAGSKLGLHITEGPHKDTQELRIHAFRWFNRYLKKDDSLIEIAATRFFEPQQLRVFEELPADERVTTIHESFVPKADSDAFPKSKAEQQENGPKLIQTLQEKSFRGWPALDAEPLDVKVSGEAQRGAARIRAVEYTSQSPYRLSMFVVEPQVGGGTAETNAASQSVTIRLLDQAGWDELSPALAFALPELVSSEQADEKAWKSLQESLQGSVGVFIAPRGVGPTQWSSEERTLTHIRRRFMLLGQTAASMQIYDVRRALAALAEIDAVKNSDWELSGDGESAVWALYASLFQDGVSQLTLANLPTANRDAPDILNVSRFVEMPGLVFLASGQVEQVVLQGARQGNDSWQSVRFPAFGKNIKVVENSL